MVCGYYSVLLLLLCIQYALSFSNIGVRSLCFWKHIQLRTVAVNQWTHTTNPNCRVTTSLFVTQNRRYPQSKKGGKPGGKGVPPGRSDDPPVRQVKDDVIEVRTP